LKRSSRSCSTELADGTSLTRALAGRKRRRVDRIEVMKTRLRTLRRRTWWKGKRLLGVGGKGREEELERKERELGRRGKEEHASNRHHRRGSNFHSCSKPSQARRSTSELSRTSNVSLRARHLAAQCLRRSDSSSAIFLPSLLDASSAFLKVNP